MAASLALAAVSGTNCTKRAGVKAIYIIPTADMVSISAGTSAHDIDDMVFAGVGNGFGRVNFKRGECEVTESMEQNNEVSVIFSVPNPNAAQRFELEAIRTSCETYAVAELYDDERLLFIGYDAVAEEEAFLSFNSLESTSGKAVTDENLFTMTLTAEQGEMLRVLSGIASATVPATTKTAILAELIAATSV